MTEFWLQYYYIESLSDEARVIFSSHLRDERLPLTHIIADCRMTNERWHLSQLITLVGASVVWSWWDLPGVFRKWWLHGQNFQLKTAQGGENTVLDLAHTFIVFSLFGLLMAMEGADWRLMERVRLMEWVRPGYNNIQACCTQAGPAHTAGCGGGMDRWQHSSHLLLHALSVASIALLWEKVGVQWLGHRHCESGNKEKRHHDRLPCGYVYRSSHWISKSVNGLHPCCCHWGVSLSMVHVFMVLNKCMTQNMQNKSRKWFTVSWWSMTDRQTDKVHVEITRKGLAHARPNHFHDTPASALHV